MNQQIKHLITVVITLLITVFLAVLSYSSGSRGYEFPQITALVALGIATILTVMAILPKKALANIDEEKIPWGSVWPMILILTGFSLVMTRLGFVTTSFIAFFVIAYIYSPEGFSLSRVLKTGVVTSIFIGVLYSIFVLLLKVQLPEGVLI